MLESDPQDHGSDPDKEIMTVRRAAEALFRPKTPEPKQEASGTAPVPQRSFRKPRILPVIKPARVPAEKTVTAAGNEKPMPPSIPASHVARIRTWLMYGMTIRQVAQVYGVAVSAIERLL